MRPSKEEVFRHYGHDAENAPNSGAGYGLWKKEDALENLKALPDFIKYLDANKKIRIVFEYDPDYPMAMLITEGAKD